MKIRSDYVTNSSSSNFLLGLFVEDPGEEPGPANIKRPIKECGILTIMELVSLFRGDFEEKLAQEVYLQGMSEKIRGKYYQFCFLLAMLGGESSYHCEGLSVEELFERAREGLLSNAGVSPMWSKEPDERGNCHERTIGEDFLEYFHVYETAEMVEAFDKWERTPETVRAWFENVTGIRWLFTSDYETGDMPEGCRYTEKMDYCDMDDFCDGEE